MRRSLNRLGARGWSAVAAAVLLCGAAAGCSSGNGGGSTLPVVRGLETTHLVVYDYPAIDSAGLFIAANTGLFKQEGLDVTVVPDFKNSQDTIDMLESGKAQIASPDYVTLMNNLSGQHQDLLIIGEGSVLQPNNLALMASPSSGVTNIKQLKGKAIPVSGLKDIANLLIDNVLNDNNVPVDSVNYVPNIPLPAVPALIKKGQFVAGPVPEPFVSEGQQQQGVTVLADLYQGANEDFPIQGFAVTRQWAEKNPNTLKAFVTALDMGQQIADTSRATLEKAIQGPPLKVPVGVAAVISVPEFPTAVNPVRLQRVMDDMIGFGFFTGKQLATAKAFKAQDHVYSLNIANEDGQSSLLDG